MRQDYGKKRRSHLREGTIVPHVAITVLDEAELAVL
jgi:hypothetical protein